MDWQTIFFFFCSFFSFVANVTVIMNPFFWNFVVLYEIQIDSGVASNTEDQVALIIEQLKDN